MQPHQPHSHVAMVHVKHTQPDLRPIIQAPAYESEEELEEHPEDDEQHAAYLAQMAAFDQKHAELAASAQAALDKPPQFYAPGPTPTPAPAPVQDQTFRLRRKALPIKK